MTVPPIWVQPGVERKLLVEYRAGGHHLILLTVMDHLRRVGDPVR